MELGERWRLNVQIWEWSEWILKIGIVKVTKKESKKQRWRTRPYRLR